MSSDDPQTISRARNGRAPDVFEPGGWVPMRCHGESDEVDFVIVGTGAGGGTLACKLAEAGFSVVAFDAGPYWRPLEDFASDEHHQSKLYWTDERITAGANPIKLGANNSGRSVGGSTVHYAMVALRFRPEWFKARTKLGYGADWPIDWQEMWRYYTEVEQALTISGPITYPWGPRRPRYPYRAHPLNAAAKILARGAEALGVDWTETPIATLSAPKGKAHPPADRRDGRRRHVVPARAARRVAQLGLSLSSRWSARDRSGGWSGPTSSCGSCRSTSSRRSYRKAWCRSRPAFISS
jgi:choline dehydrogenase-like flavoprotein